MRRQLLCLTAVAFLSASFSNVLHAQIKGDPVFRGTPAAPEIQKSSTLSPELQQLVTSPETVKAKIAASVKKPAVTANGKPVVNGSLGSFLQIRGDKVVIDVTAKEDVAAARKELQQLGATVTATYGRMISAQIPINALSGLEGSATIRFARPAYKPMHLGQKPTPVISQGDTAQLSYLARKQYHVDGKGVKVGVLSDSYNNLGTAAIGVAHGQLPGSGNPFNYRTPVQVLADLDSGGTDEGRAMLEIIHDVAPASDLAFHTADNGQADFAQGILQLANAGCSVIADDVFYYAEPFFQDGIIAQAVDQVKKQGITYFSAAGNQSVRSYESPYRGTPYQPFGPGYGTAHNFSAPGDPDRFFQPIYIPPGGTFLASFQWDQSFFSATGVGDSTDMDIYLCDADGFPVAAGNSDNLASGDPVEVFGWQNNTPNTNFYLLIVKYAGPDPQHLKYILYDDPLFYLTTPAIPGILAPTLVGHTKADGAISVGAASYLNTPPYGIDTPLVESFSSVGGVANYLDVNGNRIPPLVRNKPEIVAPDGGNTSFFDPFGNGDIPQDTDTFPNFFGTSAATPHAAGVAALMIEAQKWNTITPSQIKGILSSHTWDMDNPYTPGFDAGFDFATGYGLIKATDAVGEVKWPNSYIQPLQLNPLCSADPATTRNWQIVNPNPFEVPVTWLITGTNQHGSIVVEPGDTVFSTSALYSGSIALPSVAVIDWEDNFGFSRLALAYGSKAVCGKDVVSAATSDQPASTRGKTVDITRPAIAEVSPNPSRGLFRLYLSSAQPQNILLELYSADGSRLQTQQVSAAIGVVDIDATPYPAGVYFLKIIRDGETKTVKLIKN